MAPQAWASRDMVSKMVVPQAAKTELAGGTAADSGCGGGNAQQLGNNAEKSGIFQWITPILPEFSRWKNWHEACYMSCRNALEEKSGRGAGSTLSERRGS